MQCGGGRDLKFGFLGLEDYEIHVTPIFVKVTMETTYFQHEKQIFRNYNHDFRKEEIIWHKTNDVLFCYTFGWGNSYFKPFLRNGRSTIRSNVKYHELSVLSNSWTQSYSFLIYLNKNIEYWGKH